MLWNRSLVMRDQETGSLWSHILGEAMAGNLKGQRLTVLPSIMTDWGSWKAAHPETTAVQLPRTAEEFRRDFYQDADRFVLGLHVSGKAKAWSFRKLAADPVVNDRLGELPVAVFFDIESKTALAFDRRLEGRTLTFQKQSGQIIDMETRSIWQPLTGACNEGELQRRHLQPLPAIVSFTRAWVTFHPKTEGLSDAEIERARKPRARRRRGG